MACISKLSAGFAYDCETGATGIESAVIINKEDIASFTVNNSAPSLITDITLASGAKAYKIDTVKRSFIISEALKVNEGAPNAYTHTATITATQRFGTNFSNLLVNPVANGNFVILTRCVNPLVCRPFGLYYGMLATSVERSSHDNGGWYTITMATPEQTIGEDALDMSPEVYETIYNNAVY